MELFFHWIKGFVRMRVSGTSSERFMNLCVRQNIALWKIEQENESILMNLSVKDYFTIKSLLKKAGVKAVVIKKYGLPFYLESMKKRKIFVIGALLTLTWLLVMKNYIWSIEPQGNYKLSDEIIFDFLEEQGIQIGEKISKVDYESLEKAFRTRFTELTWVSIGINGTKLTIQMKEADVGNYEEINNQFKSSSMICLHDGVVEEIITREGIPKVKVGDLVKAGDVLISGEIPFTIPESGLEDYIYENADGDVKIRYVESYYDYQTKQYNVNHYTGEQKKEYYICAFEYGGWIRLYLKPFSTQDCVSKYMQIRLLDDFYLPIWFGVRWNREYKVISLSYTKEEMEELLTKRLLDFIASLEEKGIQNVQNDVKIYDGDTYMCIDGRLVFIGGEFARQELIPTERMIENE